MASPVERGTAVPQRKTPNSAGADNVVNRIVGRLEGRGIPDILQQFGASSVVKTWGVNPTGFEFTCNNRKALIEAFESNPGFGRSPGPRWMERVNHKVQFREVSDNWSLHVIIPTNPRDPCIVHLDSVSVVAGRDRHGNVTLKNADAIQRHLAIDSELKALRFDVTESRLSTPLDGERGTSF